MPLSSADRAFGIIAVQRKILTPELLATEERYLEEKLAQGKNVSLAQHLITAGKLDGNQRADVERIRAKHGRQCEKCLQTTYLLPGDSAATKPCEHCGGRLLAEALAAAAPPAPAPAAPAPAAPAPVEPPKASPGVNLSRRAGTGAPASVNPSRIDRSAPMFGYEPQALELPPQPAPRPSPAEAPLPEAPLPASPRFAGGGGQDAVAVARPKGPLADEARAILAFPFRGKGAILVGIMAVCAAVASILSYQFYGVRIAPALALLLLYLRAYQVKVIDRTIQGQDEPPDWPDWEETFGLGWRLLACNVATILPVLILFGLGVSIFGAPTDASRGPSVGAVAHELASRDAEIHGKSAADTEIFDLEDAPVKLGDRKGRWLVMGLLEKDDADDTGMAELIRNMPKIGIGVSYFPGMQVYDLDRLARAVPEVDVAAVFIDPRWKKVTARGLVKDKEVTDRPAPRRPSSTESHTPDAPSNLDDDEDPVFKPTKAPGVDDLPLPGSQRHVSRDVENAGDAPTSVADSSAERRRAGQARAYQKLKVWRTRDLLMPAPFANPKSICPTVWIVDPQGKVRRQFDGGASDRALYATYVDLSRGGNGNVSPSDLPGVRVAGSSVALNLIFYLGVAFAAVYGPMATLMTVVFTNAWIGFGYAGVIQSILKAGRDYAFLVVMSAGLLVAFFLCDWLVAAATARALPDLARHVVSGLLTWVLVTYGAMAEARAYGRFYLRAEGTLGWFAATEAPATNDPAQWRPGEPGPPRPTTGYTGSREPGPLGRAWNAFSSLSKGASIGIAAVGFVLGSFGLRAEMQHQSLDSFLGLQLGKMNRMRVDVRGELVTELAKMGYAVKPDEIQLAVVEQSLDKGGSFEEGSYAVLAYVTVLSPSAGFHHQFSTLSSGGHGFTYLENRSQLWASPRSQETARHFCIGFGFLLALAFLLKAFGPSISATD